MKHTLNAAVMIAPLYTPSSVITCQQDILNNRNLFLFCYGKYLRFNW